MSSVAGRTPSGGPWVEKRFGRSAIVRLSSRSVRSRWLDCVRARVNDRAARERPLLARAYPARGGGYRDERLVATARRRPIAWPRGTFSWALIYRRGSDAAFSDRDQRKDNLVVTPRTATSGAHRDGRLPEATKRAHERGIGCQKKPMGKRRSSQRQ